MNPIKKWEPKDPGIERFIVSTYRHINESSRMGGVLFDSAKSEKENDGNEHNHNALHMFMSFKKTN